MQMNTWDVKSGRQAMARQLSPNQTFSNGLKNVFFDKVKHVEKYDTLSPAGYKVIKMTGKNLMTMLKRNTEEELDCCCIL